MHGTGDGGFTSNWGPVLLPEGSLFEGVTQPKRLTGFIWGLLLENFREIVYLMRGPFGASMVNVGPSRRHL